MPPLPSKKHLLDTLEAVGSRQTDYSDSGKHKVGGLSLRVSPTGKKSWVITARRPGAKNPSRFTLADYGDISLTEARDEARDFKEKLRKGIDPVAEKYKSKAVARERMANDFAGLVELFITRHISKLKPSTAIDYERVVKKVLIPSWGKRSIVDISGADVIHLIDTEESRAPVQARLTFAVARKLFAFAVERQLIPSSVNPFTGLKAPAVPKARDRVLSEEEIGLFWTATEAIGWPYAPAFKFLLLTGQRRSEVAGVAWSEIDVEKAEWVIPADKAKNGKAHAVDLSPLALEILVDQTKIGALAFTSNGDKPLNGWSRAKKRLDAAIEELRLKANMSEQVPAWRSHDLRRTAASGMAALSFAPHVIEKTLNHTSGVTGGLTAVYQHHDYRKERKAAMAAWGRKVEQIIGPAEINVVPMKRDLHY
jgi:integrase